MSDRPKNLETVAQGANHSFDVTLLNKSESLGGVATNPDGYTPSGTPTSGQLSVQVRIFNTANQLLEDPATSVPSAVAPTVGTIAYGGTTGFFTVTVSAGGTATLSTSLPSGKFWAIAWTSTINTKTFTVFEVFSVVPTGSGSFGSAQYVSADTVAAFLQVTPFSTTTKPTLDQVTRLINQTTADIDFRTKHAFAPKQVGPEYYNYNGHGFQYVTGSQGYGVSWSTAMGGAGMDGRGMHDPTDRGRLYLRHRKVISIDELKVWNGSEEEDWLATKTFTRGQDLFLLNDDGVLIFGDSYPLRRAKVVKVKYTFGEAEVPKDIEEAAMYLVAAKIVQGDDRSVLIPEGTSNISLKDKTTTWRQWAMEILDRHKELTYHTG